MLSEWIGEAHNRNVLFSYVETLETLILEDMGTALGYIGMKRTKGNSNILVRFLIRMWLSA